VVKQLFGERLATFAQGLSDDDFALIASVLTGLEDYD
jgi:hypothetical protein